MKYAKKRDCKGEKPDASRPFNSPSPPHNHHHHHHPLHCPVSPPPLAFSSSSGKFERPLLHLPPASLPSPPTISGMGRHPSGSSFTEITIAEQPVLQWPFGNIDCLGQDELRETAYELFFTSCRSSPGFGGRTPITFYAQSEEAGKGGNGGGGGGGGANMAVTSKIKRSLGLRTRKASPPMRLMRDGGSNVSPGKGKQRPMTSAEIMRQQMGVTVLSDARLRKTLLRTLVAQTGRKAETIILPLELLRQLKPSEFTDASEYHHWQRRQLKALEAGLSLHPSVPLDHLNSAALRLREVVRSSEHKPIDVTKNSEAMRTLCGAAITLGWRSPNNSPASEACHWADGYPLNVHLYLSLIRSIFDLRDETVVLDEVDELMELMKKTWATLGINRMMHNVCFAWALFEQYVTTGQVEPDLMCAALAMLAEVAGDAKRADKEAGFVVVASAALSSMKGWAERKLMSYHEGFEKGQIGMMESVLGLAVLVARIGEDIPSLRGGSLVDHDIGMVTSLSGNRVDQYIKSSLKNAFTKAYETGSEGIDGMVLEADENPHEFLVQLAKKTETLAIFEKETYCPLLKRWHPVPAAVAVATLHNCFGVVLKQYIARITSLTNESIQVLQTAGKLEKVLVQMVVEDLTDCDDGGKAIVTEMMPYEVDSVIMSLMKDWIAERLRIGRECLTRAKETESWNPKSKSEPYAQSAVDLMKLVKVTVDEFFDIPVSARRELVQDLADGLETLFLDYTSFVSSCGSKQSYIPILPPLTRCNQDPKYIRLWQRTTPCTCSAAVGYPSAFIAPSNAEDDNNNPRPTTSRGTQRLYVRINTLHYVLAHVHSIDKSLSFSASQSPHPSPRPSPRASFNQRCWIAPAHFDIARSSIQSAILHVSGVAAYRLIFVDSSHHFYEGLYMYSVAGARIQPSLHTLKQNLTLLVAVLTDRAQPLAVREVMKASFEAFLTVLLAGGSARAFSRADHDMIVQDFESLKKAFCASGEGLVAEEVVEREAEVVEGIIALMGAETERLVEDFTTVAWEASGMGFGGGLQRIPMPPTTRMWNRSDPNTVLRVLCHRDDEAASWFLKKTFQLPRRIR